MKVSARCPACKESLDLGRSSVCPNCGWQFDHSLQAPAVSITRKAPRITSHTYQHVVIVRDASGSMAGTKARQATEACRDLVVEIAKPHNKDGFVVSVVDFAERAGAIHEVVPATRLVSGLQPIRTAGRFGGCTNVTAGLEAAEALLPRTCPEVAERAAIRPVVVLFSDGHHNTGPKPETVAPRVCKAADVITVAIGSGADKDMLRRIASSDQHAYEVADTQGLRKLLAAVGSTLSQSFTAGTPSGPALGTLRT